VVAPGEIKNTPTTLGFHLQKETWLIYLNFQQFLKKID
jgi:hypothetical protein